MSNIIANTFSFPPFKSGEYLKIISFAKVIACLYLSVFLSNFIFSNHFSVMFSSETSSKFKSSLLILILWLGLCAIVFRTIKAFSSIWFSLLSASNILCSTKNRSLWKAFLRMWFVKRILPFTLLRFSSIDL